MFESILNTATESGNLSFHSISACAAAALIMGILIAITYYFSVKGQTGRGFLGTLVLLPVLVQTIVMLVNGNLGTGVAVLGAFSLVRFRSIPGNSRDISSIFFAMVIGLACGMGYLTYAAAMTILVCVIMFMIYHTSWKTKRERSKSLRITIHEDLDYTEVFDDVFEKYLKCWERISVKTMNMGSMYQLFYQIELKNRTEEKEFIDELRCRNGNLNIQCSNYAETSDQL